MSDGREGGYIMAHRQWESSPAVQALTAEGEVVWLRLLFAANWKDSTVILRDGPRIIKRGQALISERSLAERARVGRQVVRTALETLSSAGSVIIEKVNPRGNPSCNLITILNYDRFQGDNEEQTQGVTARQPKGNPKVTRSEEGEEGEEGKKEACSLLPSEPPRPGFKAVQATLVEAFLDHRKKKYLWQGAKDTDALKRLLAVDSLPEILARWKRGLGTENKYLSVATIAQLAAKWNDLALKVTDNDRQLSGLREAADAEASGNGRSGNAIGPTRQGPSGIGKTTTTNGSLPSVGASLPPALGALLDDRGKTGDLQDTIALELGAQPGRAKTAGSVCESRADTQ